MERSYREEGQDAGVAVQPVARDLAVAEESYQRNLAERALDQLQFRTAAAEHVLAAGHAGEVERAARLRQRLFQLASDAREVLSRGCSIALLQNSISVPGSTVSPIAISLLRGSMPTRLRAV